MTGRSPHACAASGLRIPSLDRFNPSADVDKSIKEIKNRDAEDLARLGYAQQLFREMGGFSNFAISFSIISVLTGAIVLFGYGLKFAGPIINTIGWPVVSLFTLCVAASMAELASAYATAGGLYFWAYRLGGKGWGWITAWFNLIGQVTIAAATNWAAAIYCIGAATRLFQIPADAHIPFCGALDSRNSQIFVMVLIMLPQILINIAGVRLMARLNDFSVWWHIAGGALIVLLLAFFATHHNPIGFLFSHQSSINPLEASSDTLANGKVAPALVFGDTKIASPLFSIVPGLAGFYRTAPFLLVFVLGLLQAQWTYTGFDASANTAEETIEAHLHSAWGIFLSVAVSAVVGYVLVVVLTWCIPPGKLSETANDTYPVLYIVDNNLSRFFANVVAIIIGVAMWLCSCSGLNSMTRTWYAFARDEGLPGSSLIKRVSPRFGTPVWAIIAASVLVVLICLYASAFSVVTSISTIALYLAYIIPVYLNWRNRRRGSGEHTTPQTARWCLGRWSSPINFIAIGWTIFITIIFSIPPNELVFWTMLLLLGLLALYWFTHARHRFHGPSSADEKALQTLVSGT
ncbi:MAG: amino acid transporter [Verrucomicrobia bacterium]|nr:MAG: amino acid transporter [Verrucomicrobiota bacterium]